MPINMPIIYEKIATPKKRINMQQIRSISEIGLLSPNPIVPSEVIAKYILSITYSSVSFLNKLKFEKYLPLSYYRESRKRSHSPVTVI